MLFIFLLSLTASGKSQGVDGKAGAFFRQARRSGLWPEAEAVHRSAVTKTRAKLSWTAFEQLHHDAVSLAYEVWPASDAPRSAFDPDSVLNHPGKGHYPQCLVSTAYDVFRRIPVARNTGSYRYTEAINFFQRIIKFFKRDSGLIVWKRLIS